MPSLRQEGKSDFFNIDDDKISGKRVPLNIVLYNYKRYIMMLAPHIRTNPKNEMFESYMRVIGFFKDELDPYIDDIYDAEVKQEQQKLMKQLVKEKGFTIEEIEDDDTGEIDLELTRIEYRMLNRLLCRKNLLPPRTFIDTINPN